jgi:hypothetical protein
MRGIKSTRKIVKNLRKIASRKSGKKRSRKKSASLRLVTLLSTVEFIYAGKFPEIMATFRLKKHRCNENK